jgi:predicted GNAT superfamily acetyltransferase
MDSTTIEVRALTSHVEMKACVSLQHAIWGKDFSDIVPASILKVAQRIGGVVVGAFDSEANLLGFVFGLTGVERGKIVHWSDMLAVAPSARNLGLGRRLKEHQRQLVRELGASVIYWTYDPLVARNAHLNFNRLGVRVSEYADDMYGVTASVLHGGVPTDRLVVAWPTHDVDIDQNLAEARRASESDDCLHGPAVDREWIERAAGAAILPYCVRVAIPADAERLLIDNPEAALTWRFRVRQAFHWAFAAGYTIVAFSQPEGDRDGYYLMTRPVTPRSTPSVR